MKKKRYKLMTVVNCLVTDISSLGFNRKKKLVQVWNNLIVNDDRIELSL